jgi:hypothetical protein
MTISFQAAALKLAAGFKLLQGEKLAVEVLP